MVPITPLETKCQLHKGPAVCAIPICLDGRKPTYLGVAIGRVLVPNWDGAWQNYASHIAHSVVPLYTNSNPNPNKSELKWGVLTCNKTNMAFCSRGSIAHICNELRESSTTAYQT